MKRDEKGFYITTAIAYPNSRMHVGFGWEVIASDMVARFHRMQGRPVFFSTGVDEHSQNVEKAAQKEGLSAKAYCDKMAEDIIKIMGMMDVGYDRFIRTSDPDHEKVCQFLIEKAFKSGDVYKQKYEGLYCDSCEVFYTEKEAALQPDGSAHCVTHKMPLRKMQEENYFFRLSKYEEKLKKLFKENPSFLMPESRRNEVISFMEQGLKDFSVSRTSFKWGIPLPFEPEHIIYVWYDALINYLSAVKMPITDAQGKVVQGDAAFFEKFWPCDVHVIGKDITRFHCVYWPAMLWSAGIELPRQVRAHGFIYFQGEKMSKTRGNIVTPDEVIQDYGATSLRWYLLSANHFDADGNYSDEALVLKCNADLSNNIGNLVNRVLNMSIKYFGKTQPKDFGVLPAGVVNVQERLTQALGANGEVLRAALEALDLSTYCTRVLEFSTALNKFVDETKPWSLGKTLSKATSTEQIESDPELQKAYQTLQTVLAQLLEGIRSFAIALWPVTPKASEQILTQLGHGPQGGVASERWSTQTLHSGAAVKAPLWSYFGYKKDSTFELVEPQPLFPRLEFKKE